MYIHNVDTVATGLHWLLLNSNLPVKTLAAIRGAWSRWLSHVYSRTSHVHMYMHIHACTRPETWLPLVYCHIPDNGSKAHAIVIW